MKYLYFILLLTSCHFYCNAQLEASKCKDFNSHIVKVNTAKKYQVESTYCISSQSQNQNSFAEITLLVYDRITGDMVKEGWIFYGDNIKDTIVKGEVKRKLPAGNYNIGISSMNHLPFAVKGLQLDSGEIKVLSIFLGSSLQ